MTDTPNSGVEHTAAAQNKQGKTDDSSFKGHPIPISDLPLDVRKRLFPGHPNVTLGLPGAPGLELPAGPVREYLTQKEEIARYSGPEKNQPRFIWKRVYATDPKINALVEKSAAGRNSIEKNELRRFRTEVTKAAKAFKASCDPSLLHILLFLRLK
jgi:hypothetical protein